MSDWRERIDEERYDRMLQDEYAPATPYEQMLSELGRPDYEGEFGWRPPVEVFQTRGTYAELKDAKIANGECGMPACGGRLDDCGYCSECGLVSRCAAALPERRAA